MKARVIKQFTDKYSRESISCGAEIEVSQERFIELTDGPRGIFVEEIAEDPITEKTIEKKVLDKKATKK